MFHHVALVKFRPEVTTREREDAIIAMTSLRDIPGVREWTVGRQIRLNSEYELVEVSSFDDRESFERFRIHPQHRAFVDLMRRIADWTAVDFET